MRIMFADDAPPWIKTDSKGAFLNDIKELERVELQL